MALEGKLLLARFTLGDRVEHVSGNCAGTVAIVAPEHIGVWWDDNQLGMYYVSGPTAEIIEAIQGGSHLSPRLRDLLKLRRRTLMDKTTS